MTDDQSEVVAFLGDPASHGAGTGPVERLATHISRVFLVGDRAYKLKRAVSLPYADFSTVERRRQSCEAELALNRRTAPGLYLDVRPISRGADGTLGWGGDSDVVDWVVVMQRFDQACRLDAVAGRGGLTTPFLLELAAYVAMFHESAEPRPGEGGVAAMTAIVNENDDALRRAAGFDPGRIEELRQQSRTWLARVGPLLDRRAAAGKVRRCHGDLHLRNICVLDGKPVLFDCIEFSEALASIDVLYDLAFLLMDLEHQGEQRAANLVFNRYLDLTGEDDGLAAMPLFMSLRAAIRTHTTASADGGASDAAQSYLARACATLSPSQPRLIAIGGLSGTGKSTLAAALAPELGPRPGARVLRSDVVRKRLCGCAPEERLPDSAYSPEATARVYDTLCRQAEIALQAGYCAILDAVALQREERRSFAALARQVGVPFLGIWLDAPAGTLAARVATRRGDASDATPEIVERQARIDPGPLDWVRIDAGASRNKTLDTLRRAISQAGHL
jgi:aminoglycoside phosphotransferase family enzyme/predicted kinase